MNPDELIAAAAHAWAARHKRSVLQLEYPDKDERGRPAVDLLGRDLNGQPRLVLEHTLVESFLDQRTARIAAIRMFEPLEQKLAGRMPLPGHYDLSFRVVQILGLKRNERRIREWVESWIMATAPALAIGGRETAPRHVRSVLVPDTGLEISLTRWPRRDGEFGLAFYAPSDPRQELTSSLARAVAKKCPKLAAARAEAAGVESLLLLAIHDTQLGNVFDLDAVVQDWLADPGDTEVPDHIWLADTTDEPPSVMISKESAMLGQDVRERFLPFFLRPSDAPKA